MTLDQTLLCFVLVDPEGGHAFCSRYDFGPWPLVAGVEDIPATVQQVQGEGGGWAGQEFEHGWFGPWILVTGVDVRPTVQQLKGIQGVWHRWFGPSLLLTGMENIRSSFRCRSLCLGLMGVGCCATQNAQQVSFRNMVGAEFLVSAGK